MTTGDWQYHNDYTMATAATDDPRVFAVIERDEHPEMPYSDLEPPVYALDYRWGRAVDYVDGDEMADVAEAYGRARDYFGPAHPLRHRAEELTRRYLRIFYGAEYHEFEPNRGDFYVTFLTREMVPGQIPFEWYAGTVSEWTAYATGDVWGVGYAVLTDEQVEAGVGPEDAEIEFTCWGFYGEHYAREEAEEFTYGWPELPPLDKMHRDHPETGTTSLFAV